MGAIRIAEGSEACAMAGMLGSVLEENIKENPRKKAIFRAMNTVVVIQVVDIDHKIKIVDRSRGKLSRLCARCSRLLASFLKHNRGGPLRRIRQVCKNM